MTKKPYVLIICDGWGENSETKGNAILNAATPRLDQLRHKWPHTTVAASGEAVGLPTGQQGNSEVGHLTIGSGRVILQPLSQEIHDIESGNFYQNQVLLDTMQQTKTSGKALHIMGLVSPGGVHSYDGAIGALVQLARQNGLDKVYIHAFTDGRDTDPRSGLGYIEKLERQLAELGLGRIASLSGRYYAMDRDKRWGRTELAYDMLTQDQFVTTPSAEKYIEKSYDEGVTDEFLKPISIAKTPDERVSIQDGDSVIFFNFRPDRARQLSHALVDKDFNGFGRKRVVNNLRLVTFSEYDTELNVPVVFPKENAKNTLAEVISSAGLTQYHAAETEKYAHVTYFFNGGNEAPFPGEERSLVPSPKVATYDMQPEMSARQVADDVIGAIRSSRYDFIIMNFANADMVGHTGVYQATVQAIETLDNCIADIIDSTLANNGVALMTADHGNAECEINDQGQPITSHTTSPVPVLLCGSDTTKLRNNGSLKDIAPTILDLMNLEIPSEMTGTSLLEDN